MNRSVTVIGGGLAGSEAAWQLAQRSIPVLLYEMRPRRTTPAHETDRLAELVCSNSFGSKLLDRAQGLLKEEMRRLGSLIIACADATALPAGGALAVGRDDFSQRVTAAVLGHPLIEVRREEVVHLPSERSVIVATGPLTSDALAIEIGNICETQHLYFYDAMAPIVNYDSINMEIAFRASRYGRNSSEDSEGDYVNCPMTKEEYERFVTELLQAEHIEPKSLEVEDERFFEGCLPVEVLAARGVDALAFGPMRPVGLHDPRTGRRPHAVVQLRQDNLAATLYNMVGFQTSLKWGEQKRVLHLIPGLEEAEFVRYGQMHRNTFINSPLLVRPTLQFRKRDDLFFAGQIVGTEGYVGSTMGGLVAGINVARRYNQLTAMEFPRETMIGALLYYVTHAEPKEFQPMKANFGLLPDLEPPVRNKRERYQAYTQRALSALAPLVSEVNPVPDAGPTVKTS